jgi:hypothetical protein
MFRKINAIHMAGPVLAAGACLAMAGCGGGSSPASASGPSGGAGNLICVTFEQAYTAFRAGDTPPLQSGNTWDELINASGKAFGTNLPSAGVGQDVFDLMNDATNASSDLSQRKPINRDVTQFNGDLKKVGKACGMAFIPATGSS